MSHIHNLRSLAGMLLLVLEVVLKPSRVRHLVFCVNYIILMLLP